MRFELCAELNSFRCVHIENLNGSPTHRCKPDNRFVLKFKCNSARPPDPSRNQYYVPRIRVTLRYVERTQQNPYGLVVSSVEQNETPAASSPDPQSRN
jgi:hypothetical protein